MDSPDPQLTHLDSEGKASMVDVSHKPAILREARASGFIYLQAPTLKLIEADEIKKGNVLITAQLAGIQAAKQTANLIPLCHQLPLSHVSLNFVREANGYRIESQARTTAATGVEMEALAAVSIAALTIYDMCKAVDHTMQIDQIRLVEKKKENVLI